MTSVDSADTASELVAQSDPSGLPGELRGFWGGFGELLAAMAGGTLQCLLRRVRLRLLRSLFFLNFNTLADFHDGATEYRKILRRNDNGCGRVVALG